jgi:hypothetical protein
MRKIHGMQTDKEMLKAFRDWTKKRGQSEALSELTKRGVGARTAGGLVSGSYDHRPSSMLRKVLADILSDQKAAAS